MSKSKKNTAHEAFIIGRIREVRIDQNLSAERSVTPSVTTFNRSPVLRRHGRLRKHERTTFVRMPRVSFVGSARVVADLFLSPKTGGASSGEWPERPSPGWSRGCLLCAAAKSHITAPLHRLSTAPYSLQASPLSRIHVRIHRDAARAHQRIVRPSGRAKSTPTRVRRDAVDVVDLRERERHAVSVAATR